MGGSRWGRLAGIGWVLGTVVLVTLGRPAEAHVAGAEAAPDTSVVRPAGADTVSAPGEPLLERLQEEDRRFYPEELLETDPALRDSALAALDSLGLAGYEHEYRAPFLEASLGIANSLITYNRVEAVVAGLGGDLDLRGGTHINVQAAYATGPRKFRHLETLEVPAGPLVLEAGYADRVTPYGSNRPVGNGIRALVGSADEQDYLRRLGGHAGVRVEGRRGGRFGVRYEATKDRSVKAQTDFAFLGNHWLMGPNPPIDEGMTRSLVVAAAWGRLGNDRLEMDLRHRIAGGGLGGDFDFVRTDFRGSIRRYLPGNHEAVMDLAVARAGGTPPIQALADVGGISTVLGFDRRTHVGRSSLAGRLEVYPAFDPIGALIPALSKVRIQFVPWAGAGRVWDGDSDAWITSAGIGVQRYLAPLEEAAYLRLDAAFPMGPERPETVRFYLGFNRALF